MLPAPTVDGISLADVLASCLSSVVGAPNRLTLRPSDRIVIVLIDGLGADALRARAGHARTLSSASGSAIETVFPTTTAAALTSLATGERPGQHGLVGYSVLDVENDRIVNQLSGWDERLDPLTWQRKRTLFEQAQDDGLSVVAVGPARYADSGFTQAVLRGAEYRAAASIADRFAVASAWLQEPGAPGVLYLYVPELDTVAHATGWESPEWTERLELVDAEVRGLVAGMRDSHGVVVTADHGIVDVPQRSHLLIDSVPALLDGIRHVAGEPRFLQLHFDHSLTDSQQQGVVDRWRESESGRSWVATRSEAIAANWFGPVDPAVEPRIGDLLVAARKNVAYYDSRTANAHAMSMVGQHGSWTAAELRIPLVRFGAVA